MRIHFLLGIVGVFAGGCAGPAGKPPPAAGRAAFPGEGWPGHAICYSGFREGQDPPGLLPTREQVREDLLLLAPRWRYLRTYAASQHARDVLEVIREERLDMRVALGAWLACEQRGHPAFAEANAARNDAEVAAAIAMANAFPDVVVAVIVGNETLVDWSFQPVPAHRVTELVRRVQQAVSVPVTVADNYKAWTTPEGVALAEVVDFVMLHSYPLWVNKDIDEALETTIRDVQEVRAAVGPHKRLVIGEAGWATYTTPGDPFHVPGAGSEEKQAVYFRQLHDWARQTGIPVFWFEAFDEPWKGAGTEGHWGLYDVHRRPRQALR